MVTEMHLVPSSGLARVDLSRTRQGVAVVLASNAEQITLLERQADPIRPRFSITTYRSADEWCRARHNVAANACYHGIAYSLDDDGEPVLSTDDADELLAYYQSADIQAHVVHPWRTGRPN